MTKRTPPQLLNISEAGVDLITSFEGFVPYPYWDLVLRNGKYEEWTGGRESDPVKGTVTIGYGHTNLSDRPPRIVPGMRMTKPEAERVLREVLRDLYEREVKRLVKVPLYQHEFDALVSFVYNVGGGNLGKSTLLRRLNKGEYAAVPSELMKWTKSKGRELRGLVRRRRAEAEMWRGLRGDVDDAPEPRPRAGEVEATKAPSPIKDLEGWVSVGTPVATIFTSLADWRIALIIALLGAFAIGAFVWSRNRDKGA